MMDSAALQVLVAEAIAQALVAMATTRDNFGGSGGSAWIHKHHAPLEKLVPEDWKERQYQFGTTLEILLWLDEVSTGTLEHQMRQEQSKWMSVMFSVLSLLTRGEANKLVRSCEDENGHTAWKRLYDRLFPKTPASFAAVWREVIKPMKIKGHA